MLIRLALLFFISGCTAGAVDTPVVIEAPVIVETPSMQRQASPNFRMHNSQCMPIAEMSASLLRDYNEKLASTATMTVHQGRPVRVIVLFYASKSASWSIVVVNDNGISCLVMWGENWKRNRSNSI
jgi:hypothetical protein